MNAEQLLKTDYNTRREFLNKLTLGTAGVSAGLFTGCATGLKQAPQLNRASGVELSASDVSLVSGNDRRDMIVEALSPFESHLQQAIGDKQVIIKVNMVSDSKPLCAAQALFREGPVTTIVGKNRWRRGKLIGSLPLFVQFRASSRRGLTWNTAFASCISPTFTNVLRSNGCLWTARQKCGQMPLAAIVF